MPSRIRAAVIGCGTYGAAHLANYAAMSADIEIVAVCDFDEARAAALAQRYGVGRTYTSAELMFAVERIDLVSVCTMPDTHAQISTCALNHRAHVLCEKPPGLSAPEIADLIATAKRNDRLLVFGFNMRFRSHAAAFRSFVAKGGIGRLVAIRAWAFHSFVPWTGKHQIKALSGGGALASSAVHIIDLAMWIAGSPLPTAASASMAQIFPAKRAATAPARSIVNLFDVEDTLGGHVRFDDGSWMTIDCAWGQDSLVDTAYGFEMIGDVATIQWDPARVIAERDGVVRDITGEVLGNQSELSWEQEAANSLRAEILDLVAAIRSGGKPRVLPEQALAVQSVIDALYRSAGESREVPVILLPAVA
jgi:predicted dehydrogenase